MYRLSTAHRGSWMLLLAVALLVATGCSSTEETILDNEIIGPGDDTLPDGFVATDRPENPALKHSIPCPLDNVPNGFNNEAVTLGCPFIDCIPAIETPNFVSVGAAAAMYLDNERIMVVEREGQVRGFPIRILIYHEVVNVCWDLSGGQDYSVVTYCPIVDVAMHFNRDFECFKQRRQSYGVSSGIFNGNLIVYQRGTEGTADGIYVQMYGGGLNNDCLDIERVNLDVSWAMFRKLYPNAKVLSMNQPNPPASGYELFGHPYQEFWTSNSLCVNGLCFPLTNTDSRLTPKQIVYGVFTESERKAYPQSPPNYVVNDNVGGVAVVVWDERGSTIAYEAVVDEQELTFSFKGREGNGLPLYEDAQTKSLWTFDGIAVTGPLAGRRLAHMVGYRAFWFAWAAMWPASSLHTSE